MVTEALERIVTHAGDNIAGNGPYSMACDSFTVIDIDFPWYQH